MSRRRIMEPPGQSSTAGKEARDPRTEDVVQTFQEIKHIMGRQAKEWPVTFARAAEFTAIATVNGNNASLGREQMARNRMM